MDHLYADIARRTGGNIYIGVVGPVRTGKSTLIKRIMEQLVIPNISDPYRAQRARDELPQSGSGRTIMTAEPKFVPEEAAQIAPEGRIRLIDTVGYMIPGATGATEDGQPRMVTTPWFDQEIPMTQAAELGTKKVMEAHCTVGLVVTTDGTVTDIPRSDYEEAEDRAIRDMQATGKPFLVIVNSLHPQAEQARRVRDRIEALHGITPAVCDCQSLEAGDISGLLHQLLLSFPLGELRVHLPRWLDALEPEHPLKAGLWGALLEKAGAISSLGTAATVLETLTALEESPEITLSPPELATGTVTARIRFPEGLFYKILSQRTGLEIANDGALLSLLTELSAVKQEYDRIADALHCVSATGYGVVNPSPAEMTLKAPEVLKKNGAYGVRLKATAPSIHMIRVDMDTEISPMVGDEQQSRELVDLLCSQEPENLWQSHIFGKSVYELLQEGLNAKLLRTPEEVRGKFRGTLTRIVNEGATGLICLIL